MGRLAKRLRLDSLNHQPLSNAGVAKRPLKDATLIVEPDGKQHRLTRALPEKEAVEIVP